MPSGHELLPKIYLQCCGAFGTESGNKEVLRRGQSKRWLVYSLAQEDKGP